MIQYNGITLLRDENGTPLQVNIDLRVHGTEMDSFMRAHGLASLEQNEMARSVTGEDISSTYGASGKAQSHVRYLPEVKKQIQTEIDRLFANPHTQPAGVIKKEFPDLLLHRIARALTPCRGQRRQPQGFSNGIAEKIPSGPGSRCNPCSISPGASSLLSMMRGTCW